MNTKISPRVVIADRVDGGVFIEFSDTKSGLYSSTLLYSMLPQAEQLVDAGSDD